jgi:hypothetical protein
MVSINTCAEMVNYVIRTHQEHPIPADAVRRLYAANEWCPERSLQDITDVLNRNPAVGAWKEEDLIGFARAVLDGHFRAYIGGSDKILIAENA